MRRPIRFEAAATVERAHYTTAERLVLIEQDQANVHLSWNCTYAWPAAKWTVDGVPQVPAAGDVSSTIGDTGSRIEWNDCSNFGYGDMSSCKARCRAVPECKYANYDASQNMCGKNGYCKITKSSVLGAIGNWGHWTCRKPTGRECSTACSVGLSTSCYDIDTRSPRRAASRVAGNNDLSAREHILKLKAAFKLKAHKLSKSKQHTSSRQPTGRECGTACGVGLSHLAAIDIRFY